MDAASEARKPAGIVSVVALCVFTAFALVYGLLDETIDHATLPDHVAITSTQGQHTTPVVPKRPLTAAEWRVSKATAPSDDGKSKLFLISSGPLLFVVASQSAQGSVGVHRDATASSYGYRARGPPTAA